MRVLPRGALLAVYALALPLLALHALWMTFDQWLPGELVYDTAPRWAILGFNYILVAMIAWRLVLLLKRRRAGPEAADRAG